MKLVVLLGIMCVGLAVEVSAMNGLNGLTGLNGPTGLNLQSGYLLGSLIDRLKQIILSFVHGLIATLTNTKYPLDSSYDDSYNSWTSGSGMGSNKVSGNLDDDDGGFNNIGNNAVDNVDISGNIGHLRNIGKRGPPVKNGAKPKYGIVTGLD
uniref:Uncharacterized protein n=1 Tax=Cacopsylla melanoneura TaxID=428564 RepID=A0A8D8S2H8_9HEMI